MMPNPNSHPLRRETPAFSLENLGAAALAPLLEVSLDGYLMCDAGHSCLYINEAACALFGYRSEALLGRSILSLFQQNERKEVARMLEQSGSWTALIVRPQGEKREIECRSTVVEGDAGRVTVIVTRDITRQRQLERKAEVLAQFATSMAGADSLEATLNVLARSVVQATGIMACLVPLISGNPPQFRVVGSYGLPEGYAAALGRLVLAGAHPPTVQAFNERRTVVAEGVRQSKLADPLYSPVHKHLSQVGWDTVVCIPMIYRGVSQGIFAVYYPPGPAPSESEIAFFSTIADQAAVAVENARLLVEAQGKAALEERQRLARELHDSVSQALYGITLGAQAARAFLETDQRYAAESLDYVLGLAKGCHAEMRSLIFALRPESLAVEGLVVAMSRHAAALCARYELTVKTSFCAEPTISLEQKEAFYRIVQEALHNVVKHAHAQRIELHLYERDADIVLEVHDDGIGFDPAGSFPGHLGLHSMHERATSLGGTLDFQSAPGRGTMLRVQIPFYYS